MSRRRLHGDDGASLMLALALVLLIGAGAVALTSLSGTSIKDTAITRSRVNQLYAADGAIDTGIQTMQTDQADGTTNYCPAVGTSFAAVAASTINSKPVTVTCKTTSGGTTSATGGGNSLLGGYSAVLGTDGLVIDGNTNGSPPMAINGDVYSGGPITVPSATPLRIDGDLDYYAACPPLPANVTLSNAAHTTTGACSRLTTPPTVAVPTVVVPTVAALPSQLFTATCRIYYPGVYTTPPAFSSTGSYYLASGTYYFAGPGDVNLTGTIIGGAPATAAPVDTKQITGSSACATDANAQTKDARYVLSKAGTGVSLILGGNGVFRAQSGTTIELYSRVPVATSVDYGATPRVSIWGRETGQANYVGLTNNEPFVIADKTSTVVIHGLTYLPDSTARIREPLNPGATAATFMGGVALQGLHVNMDGNTVPAPTAEEAISGTTVVPGVASDRTTLICGTASPGTSKDLSPPTVIEAAVFFSKTAGVNPVVKVWRKVSAC